MRHLQSYFAFILFAALLPFYSCNKTENFTSEPLEDYFPLTIGKSITYRLDSLVFKNFNKNIEIHPYQEKHVIDTVYKDLSGNTTYRVYVSQRDSAGTGPWQQTRTYAITPFIDQIEVNDDNFRFIKIHLPLKDGFSWKGNRYLPANPYGGRYNNFSNDDAMPNWDYYYDGGPSSFTYKGKNYDNVYSVEQDDESFNVPVNDIRAYGAKSRAVEKYAKDIGLVYKEFTLWEYQPDPTGGPNFRYFGFGITMWMIDHN